MAPPAVTGVAVTASSCPVGLAADPTAYQGGTDATETTGASVVPYAAPRLEVAWGPIYALPALAGPLASPASA